MNFHVIIPWHGGGDDRLAVLGFVQHLWRTEFPDWSLTIGMLSADSDWCKADAVEIGIRDAHAVDDDVIVLADADVWVDPYDLVVAADAVADGIDWALPHRMVHRLSERATEAVLRDDYHPGDAVAEFGYDREPYVGTVGGGITMIRLAAYRDCPLDPRFVGWGQEDESWGDALRTLVGRRHRGNGDLWHLWHPPMPRMAPGIGSIQSKHLRDRYHRYVGNEARMRSLVESGREHLID